MKNLLSYKSLLRLMLVLALLPVGLLLFAVFTADNAQRHASDIDRAGSLRYLSLWIYGAKRNLPPSFTKAKLDQMKVVRSDLAAKYPEAMQETDPQWRRFTTKAETGTLDWETSRRMCVSYDHFVGQVHAQVQTGNSRAIFLFGGGVVGIGLFLSVSTGVLRRASHQELSQRATDDRFRVLFEYSSDAHLLFDSTGIVDCNEATTRLLGCEDKQEVLSLHPAVLSPEFQPDGRASLEKCLEMDRIAHEKGYHRFEWIHRKKDGTDFPVEVTLTPVMLQGIKTILVVWHDLTKRKRAEQLIRDGSERLEEAQAIAHIGSWSLDLASGKVHWSPEMFRIFDFTPSEDAPTSEEIIARYHPDYLEAHNTRLHETIVCGTPLDIDLPLIQQNGRERWVHVRGRRVKGGTGEDGYRMIGTVQDITERIQTEEALNRANAQLEEHLRFINEQNALLEAQQLELKALATTDGLTGLKNHRAFQERLAEEFHRVERYHPSLSLVLLDVDHFKQYNDSFGHPEGDKVLKLVAQLLKSVTRDCDLVARYGGEEFVVILPETDSEGAMRAAERIRKAIEEAAWTLRPVTASFGVTTLHTNTESPQTLISEADEALYAAKRNGRNRSQHYGIMEGVGSR